MLPHVRVNLEEVDPFSSKMKPVYKSQHLNRSDELFSIGTFSRLMVGCAEYWNIIDDKIISHMSASFEMGEGLQLALVQSHGALIEVSIWSRPEAIRGNFIQFLLKQGELLSANLSACSVPESPQYKILCPHWRTPEDAEFQCCVEATLLASGKLQPKQTHCVCHRKPLSTEVFNEGTLAIAVNPFPVWFIGNFAQHSFPLTLSPFGSSATLLNIAFHFSACLLFCALSVLHSTCSYLQVPVLKDGAYVNSGRTLPAVYLCSRKLRENFSYFIESVTLVTKVTLLNQHTRNSYLRIC